MAVNLRPLSLGEILDRTAQLYRENFILFAEKRPPTSEDKICLRVADERCAKFTGFDQKHVEFDLNKATLTEMPYADVFTPDGRILTKITPERKAIIDRFAGQTFDGHRSNVLGWQIQEHD